MKRTRLTQPKSLRTSLNQFAQLTLFTGAAMWLLLSWGFDVGFPSDLSYLELFLVIAALGTPAAVWRMGLEAKKIPAKVSAQRIGLGVLSLLTLTGFFGHMPFAFVAGLSALPLVLVIPLVRKQALRHLRRI